MFMHMFIIVQCFILFQYCHCVNHCSLKRANKVGYFFGPYFINSHYCSIMLTVDSLMACRPLSLT
ncbi:hypothetical protein AALO_G00300850, partial [Alosa alosa]